MKYISIIVCFLLVILSGITIIFVSDPMSRVAAGIVLFFSGAGLIIYMDNLQTILSR